MKINNNAIFGGRRGRPGQMLGRGRPRTVNSVFFGRGRQGRGPGRGRGRPRTTLFTFY